MPNYRRAHQPGGTYFFTVNLRDRRSRTLTDNIDRFRQSVAHVRKRHPFTIDAAVILPEHLHMIWTLPDGDADFSTRWRLIKHHFSRGLNTLHPTPPIQRPSHQRAGEIGLWQRRFYEHLIRDEDDFANHVDYIHFNPVKHNHCDRPIDWPHSSIHRYIKDGILTPDWGTNQPPPTLNDMGLE